MQSAGSDRHRGADARCRGPGRGATDLSAATVYDGGATGDHHRAGRGGGGRDGKDGGSRRAGVRRGGVYDVGVSECRGACSDGGLLCHLQRGRGEGVGGRYDGRKRLGVGCLGGGDGGLGWVDRITIIYDERLRKMGPVSG